MIEYLHIFVEGANDKQFIESVFDTILKEICVNYVVIEYAKKEKKKINNYINSINSIPQWDYVFIGDQDGNVNKKDKLLSKYTSLDSEKVFISVYEIESWIIAGITEKFIKKHKLCYKISDTSSITKESFDDLIPLKMERLEFISYIFDDYKILDAINYNHSLKIFYTFLANKKAS